MHTSTPLTIADHVSDFCRLVVPNSEPLYLAVEPARHADVNDCYTAVAEQVRHHGGTTCYGWQIWEWPRVMIEAEFHAVWRDLSGALRDITPKVPPIKQILFLPDPNRQYEGRQVNNIRRALQDGPEVLEFFAACNAEFEFMNRGARSDQHGQVVLTGPDAREYTQIIHRKKAALEHILRRQPPPPGRNDPCPCGSGQKYKRCHGR